MIHLISTKTKPASVLTIKRNSRSNVDNGCLPYNKACKIIDAILMLHAKTTKVFFNSSFNMDDRKK